MKSTLHSFALCSAFLVAVLFLPLGTFASAQDETGFATQGSIELGGSISFQSVTSVFRGQTAEHSLNIFQVEPYFGYFVADGFELGVNPLGVISISQGDNRTTYFTFFAAPSYNFRTGGIAYPFIEALLGYTSVSAGGSSASGFSWGGRAGVKLAVTGKGLLNLGIQYLQITRKSSGQTERSGENELTISVGFTVWF